MFPQCLLWLTSIGQRWLSASTGRLTQDAPADGFGHDVVSMAWYGELSDSISHSIWLTIVLDIEPPP